MFLGKVVNVMGVGGLLFQVCPERRLRISALLLRASVGYWKLVRIGNICGKESLSVETFSISFSM